MILQKLIFPYIGDTKLYFHINDGSVQNKQITLNKNGFFKTDTFFNIFSAGKWFKYTDLRDLSLKIAGKGRAKLSFFQLRNDDETEREVFSTDVQLDESPSVELPSHVWQIDNGMIFFTLTAYDDCVIEKADYTTKTHVNTDVVIAVNICTYRREEYLKANLAQLQNEILNNPESPLYDKLEVFIADNGRTLGNDVATDKIHIFPNANTGGAGGFSRGLYEILAVCDEKKITHTIFMDDDIKIIAQVIERTAAFLCYIKEESAECVIPGAMLDMDAPDNQYEFAARWNATPVALHKNLDLLDSKSLIANDKENANIDYAGWWYCCMPIATLKRIGYPMPFFIHGDDIEYGMRLKLPFILLNGIGVWHEPFDKKCQLLNTYYDTRNYLAVDTLYDTPVNIVSYIFSNIFWRTATYKYWDVDLFLKGVRDFCKGAKWLLQLDSEKNHMQLLKKVNNFITDKTITELPENFVHIKKDTAKTYNALKTILTLNGWLLPANRNVILDTGTDAHEAYRAKKVIWYFPALKQGFMERKSFSSLLKILLNTFYTCIIVIFRYKRAQTSYKKSFDELCKRK